MLPYPPQIDRERVAQVTRLLAQVMRRDVQAQGEFIVRTLGRTEAVYTVCSEPGTKEPVEERRLLREQIQGSVRVSNTFSGTVSRTA